MLFRRVITNLYAPLRIRQELRQKGFPSEIIARVLEENRNWIGMHSAKIQREKFGTGKPKDFKERAKQIRHSNIEGLLRLYHRVILID